MLKRIDGLPTGAIGFVAHGQVKRNDSRRVVDESIASADSHSQRLRVLYVAGEDFDGYDLGSVYDDAVFGTRHFTRFERIAFVADESRYTRSVAALDGLMPAKVKVFPRHQINDARAWLAG